VKISVIVPAFQRPDCLRICLSALLSQTGLSESPEIIVVDDGSQEPLGAPPRVRLLRQNNQGPAGARNTGLEASTGDLILFTDDDCIPARDWVAQMVDWLDAHPAADGVSGKVLNRNPHNRYARVNQSIIDGLREAGERAGEAVPFATTNNIAYRAAVFSDGFRFDTGFLYPGGEERELHVRMAKQGYSLGHCEGAIVIHDHAPSIVGFVRQQMAYGGGGARLDRLHDSPGDIGLSELFGVAAKVVAKHPIDLPVLVISQMAVAAGRVRERALTRLRGDDRG
jgi:glycosyltransferase involved in cell wall biosynthesis